MSLKKMDSLQVLGYSLIVIGVLMVVLSLAFGINTAPITGKYIEVVDKGSDFQVFSDTSNQFKIEGITITLNDGTEVQYLPKDYKRVLVKVTK